MWKLITDLKEIKKLAALKEDENWRFRCYLKGCDIGVGKLDAIVHDLNTEVSAQIDCQTCGNCCRVMHPILQEKDIARLADHLAMSSEEFKDTYLLLDEDGDFIFRASPCPFLSDNSCTVYSARPEDCRSYPHLHKKEFVSRVSGVFANCSCCPIVYNVYEMLKDEVQGDTDDFFVDDWD